jgi:probable HAF family extracellular repeat protein
MCFTAITLLVALAMPLRFAAQDKKDHNQDHHYKLIDLGTFGGPTGWLCNDQTFGGDACPVLNSRGTVVSGADTFLPNPNYGNPSIFLPPTGSPPGDPFIQHAFQWQGGVLQDLGTLPGGYNSTAFAISKNGLVAGASETGAMDPLLGVPAADAVLWKNGKIIDLGPIEGGYESAAIAVNDRGQAAGYGLNTVPDNFWFFSTQARAFFWQNGAIQDLGTLGTGTDAFAFFINDRGQIAGASFANTTVNPVLTACTLFQLPIPTQDPFLWENGKMTDLGTFGGTCGLPNAMNNRGQVVGQSDLAGDASFHAFVWTSPGPMQDLGTLGGSNSAASWINDAEDVVGSADISPTAYHAFLWRHGVMTDLGTLGSGSGPCSGALGINSNRQVVGSSGDCLLDQTSHAFLWENGQITDLNIFNHPGSGLQQLMLGYNVNDRGEIDGLGVPPGVNPADVFTLGHVFALIPCEGNDDGCQGGGGENAVPQTNPASSDVLSRKPLQSLMRGMNRYHFPDPAFGPRN